MKIYIVIITLIILPIISGCGDLEKSRYECLQQEFPNAVNIKHSGINSSSYLIKEEDGSIWEVTTDNNYPIIITYKNRVFDGTNNFPIRLRTNRVDQAIQVVLEK